jgi:hypothetical protein
MTNPLVDDRPLWRSPIPACLTRPAYPDCFLSRLTPLIQVVAPVDGQLLDADEINQAPVIFKWWHRMDEHAIL